MLMPTAKKAIRKDASKNQLALRGLLCLLVLLLLLGLIQLRSNGTIGGPPEVVADLRNAGGSLAPGSDVKVRGVIVGRVTEIEGSPAGGVRVRMLMDEELLEQVPDDVVARILPATVFGTSFVDLVPQAPIVSMDAIDALDPGAVVPADASQGTLEIQQALDDIDRLVKALGPAELSTAIGAASVALAGRGDQLGTMAEKLDSYLARFTPKLELLRTDLAKLADLLAVVEQVAPDLLQATDNGLDALNALVEHQDDLQAILVNATSVAKASDEFLRQNREALTRFVTNGYRLLDAIYDNRVSGISGAIAANQRVGAIVDAAVERGYLKVDANLQDKSPAGRTVTGDGR